MSEPEPERPLYLIVTDHNRGVAAVEGPLTDERSLHVAARRITNERRPVLPVAASYADIDELFQQQGAG
jgi:hypothetical protein